MVLRTWSAPSGYSAFLLQALRVEAVTVWQDGLSPDGRFDNYLRVRCGRFVTRGLRVEGSSSPDSDGLLSKRMSVLWTEKGLLIGQGGRTATGDRSAEGRTPVVSHEQLQALRPCF